MSVPATDAEVDAALAVGRSLLPRSPLKLGVYQHYKGPLYLVTAVALHTETEEPFVHYRCLYVSPQTNPANLSFIRPLTMFQESVQWAPTKVQQPRTIKRFTLVREMNLAENAKAAAFDAQETPAATPSAAAAPSTASAAAAGASPAPTSAASSSSAAAPASPASCAPCSNPACPSPLGAPTMCCARCKSGVAYCSVACQKADWTLSHKARCFPVDQLSVAAVRELVQKKGALAYVDALRMLSRLQQLRLPGSSDAAALERGLREEIRSKMFDVTSLYGKNARAVFTGDSEPTTTYARTIKIALEWAPQRCLPPASSPLVVLWLGARDSNEGATDWRHLSSSVFGAQRSVELYLVGPASTPQKEGLSATPAVQSFGALKVHRVVGMYPAVAVAAQIAAPQVHVVCAFNAGLDSGYETWAPAIDHALGLSPPAASSSSPSSSPSPSPPLVVISGYSTDSSSLQDEEILRAWGAEIVLPTRRSPHGFALMPPHVSNHHITMACGRAKGAEVATEPKQRAQQIATIKRDLIERGFDLR